MTDYHRHKGDRIFSLLIALTICCVLLTGCLGIGRRAKVIIECDQYINKGLLLTVDFIWATESEKSAILRIGPDGWWSSPYRKGLVEPELTTVTLRGGEQEPKRVPLRRPKKAKTLIIFANYRGVQDKAAQQIVGSPRGLLGKKMHIRVHEDRLELVD